MKKKIFIFLFLVSSIILIQAMDITFFYSKNCPHCQRMKPFVMKYVNNPKDNNNWHIFEVSYPDNKKEFLKNKFTGVPAFLIKTDDCRIIKFQGEDYLRLKCELNQMTTKECPTYSAEKNITGSWFKF